MKILVIEHYQSMTVQLVPGIHEVPNHLGKYLIDNGYAAEAPAESDEPNLDSLTINEAETLHAQFGAAQALLNGKTPDVLLGEGLNLTDGERAILEATGHPVTPKADKPEEPAHTGNDDPAEEPAPAPTGNDGAPKPKGKQK